MTVVRAKLLATFGAVRPRDVRVAVVVGVIQVAATIGASHHQGPSRSNCWWASRCEPPTHLGAVAVVLLVLGPTALLLRRVHPRAVLATVFAVTLLYVALGYLQGPNYASLAVALIAAAMHGDRTATAVALIAGWVLFLWLPDALGHTGAPTALAALMIAAWLLVLFAGAEAIRGKRDRAIEARRARAQESRRRAGEERLRIARELHDVLAHSISVINVQSGVALHLIDEQPEQARTALAAINEASAEALREVRSVLGVLRGDGEDPPRAPTAGLARLDELVSRATAAGVVVSLEVDGDERPLPASLDLAAFRIVQESLTNIVRHAGAGRATVTLAYGQDELGLQIDDDGSGADAPSAGGNGNPQSSEKAIDEGGGNGIDEGSGNGIAGMRERALALGGDLEAGPRPAGGFRVRARLPLGGAR